MGRNDNRRSPKMRRRIRQAKKKTRIARRNAALKAGAASAQAAKAPAAPKKAKKKAAEPAPPAAEG